MIKKVFALICFLGLTIGTKAQTTVSGKLSPFKDYSYALLYKLDGMEQKFIDNTSLVNGEFQFDLSNKGVYRVVFDLQNGVYLDVFSAGESIAFELNPANPDFSVQFSQSLDNQIYYRYKLASSMVQNKLDEIQVAYFKDPSQENSNAFQNQLKVLKEVQATALSDSKGRYIEPFIEASIRENPEEPVASPADYLNFVKSHYFDHLDFSEQRVLESDYFYTKITDYIFYLNYSEDEEVQAQLYQKAISEVLAKIDSDSFKATTLELILSQFESMEDVNMVEWVIEDKYVKLPYELQDNEFLADVRATLATALGAIAPNFSWEENGQSVSLSDVYQKKPTILIFWSSGCSHCLAEIPELYKAMEKPTPFDVVAVGLEDAPEEWNRLTAKMPNWHHVLGLEKWENPIARNYNIIGTPTYIVLDTSGRIIGKPQGLETLKGALSL